MKVWIVRAWRPLFSDDLWIEKVFGSEDYAIAFIEQKKLVPESDKDISYCAPIGYEIEFSNGDFVHELQGYLPVEGPSQFPSVTVEELKEKLSSEHLRRLKHQAMLLACLAGNAFPDLMEQYMVDAYNSMWVNGYCYRPEDIRSSAATEGGYPLLYPKTVVECWKENKNAE